jgi:hypothetical protein
VRLSNEDIALPEYQDHVGLWANDLRRWVPGTVFDAHAHVGLPEFVGPFSAERLKEPLSTFASLSWEELNTLHRQVFAGKTFDGLIAFGWPVREVSIEAANAYIIRLMKEDPRLKGFMLTHPTDVRQACADFDRARRAGVRFFGVKPYFDFLGKSNYKSTMPEFIPEALLAFMDAEELILMLHTSGLGMGETDNREFVARTLDRYPRLKIILAHMGRYLDVEQFRRFCDSDLFEHPRLYLEMSSASQPEVYEWTLAKPSTHRRLLFGTDFPFGLLTGVEAWSPETGPVFITRDRYAWSDDAVQRRFAAQAKKLTYNTYHVIAALQQAMERTVRQPVEAAALKQAIFHDNAVRLFS